ncbi:MAG: hypothetical protein IKG83_03310 [Prevotella sp.]|nr:hypothetical protein [Prevotella sp.]
MKKYSPTRRMIYGFANSEIEAARVIWSTDYKNAVTAYQCIKRTIKRYFANYNIDACIRGDDVYLVKGDLNELL